MCQHHIQTRQERGDGLRSGDVGTRMCGVDMALERQKPCLAGGRDCQEGGLEGTPLEREGLKGMCWHARKPRGGPRVPYLKWTASVGLVGQDRACLRTLQVRAAAQQGPRGEEPGQGHSPAILVLLMEQGCWVGSQDRKATVGVCTPAMRGLPELSSGGP